MSDRLKIYLKFAVPLLLVILVLALLISSLGKKNRMNNSGDAQAVSDGVAYLQALQNADPATVDDVLKYNRQQDMVALRNSLIEKIESGEVDVWSQFTDYVLLGDSRAVGFYLYDYLPETRVLAEGGATIRALQEHIPDILELHPSNLFFCYGLNDVSIGIWPTPEDYAAEFADIIQEIREQLPEVNIYISSILPAQEQAFETESSWRNIPEYSAAVREMCADISNCCYVDNDDIAEKYADLYDPGDGIHLQKAFYPYWAANMIMEVYEHELNDESNSD